MTIRRRQGNAKVVDSGQIYEQASIGEENNVHTTNSVAGNGIDSNISALFEGSGM